jgi:hypothetical protein
VEEEEEEQLQEEPAKKKTRNVRGQIRKYYFMKSVKSMEELDKFRFKVMLEKNRFGNIIVNFH